MSYKGFAYDGLDRWASYYYQTREILSLRPFSVLEIGVGNGVVGSYLKENTNIEYTSLDVDKDTKPDILLDIRRLKEVRKHYDVVCCFEVLEHLPFEEFSGLMEEIHRIAGWGAVISLPHFGPPIKGLIKLPLLPEIRWATKVTFPAKHKLGGEHLWEIGKRGYPTKKVRKIIKKNFKIVNEFVPFENQYHHFFTLTTTYPQLYYSGLGV